MGDEPIRVVQAETAYHWRRAFDPLPYYSRALLSDGRVARVEAETAEAGESAIRVALGGMGVDAERMEFRRYEWPDLSPAPPQKMS